MTHHVITIRDNKLQMRDTEKNKVLTTYGNLKYDGWNKIDSRDVKCNWRIMMVKFGFDTLNIYDIYTGKTINKMDRVSEFDICKTHMIISSFGQSFGKKKVIITDLNTMKEINFYRASKLFRLCINSKYVAGIDISTNKLFVYDYKNMHIASPVIEFLTFHTHLLMNDTHIVLMSKRSEHNSVSIVSLETKKIESEHVIGGNDCKLWLNPMNNSIYISSWLTSLSVQVLKIDSNTLQQIRIDHDSRNFAIGTAIACFNVINIGKNIGKNKFDSDNICTMKIQYDDTNIINKVWEENINSFNIKAVVLDEKVYVKQMLVEHVISDITNIILGYITH